MGLSIESDSGSEGPKTMIERTFHVVILLVVMLPSHLSVQGRLLSQYFVMTPMNLTVNSGEHVRLRCEVGNIAGYCQWTREGFGLGLDRQLPSFPRYLMPEESGRDGVCDLAIDPVLPLDEGVYQCQVSAGPGSPAISSPPVKLSVNSPPGLPHIIQAREVDQLEVEKGELVELQCETQGGRPAAELNWVDESGARIISDVTQHVTKQGGSNWFKTVSVLRLTVEQPKKVSCTAHSDAFPIPRVSRSLDINFGKKPVEEVKQAMEGESFELQCDEKGDMKYKWFINNNLILDEKENTLKLIDFTKTYDKTILKCVAEDKSGKSKIAKLIKLEHVLVPVQKPSSAVKRKLNPLKKPKFVNTNKKMFTCMFSGQGDEDENPEYVLLDGEKQENGEIAATDDSNKKYTCIHVSGGYKKIKQLSSKSKSIFKNMKLFSKTLDQIIKSIQSS